MNSKQVRAQIENITSLLVEHSLCDEQNFPSIKNSGEFTLITIPGDPDIAAALKSNKNYSEIYQSLDKARSFNFRMLDGAIVQLLYQFNKNEKLVKHRLSYFPSPSLESFQNDPEVYECDEIYAEVLMKNIVPFPLRFDYSFDEKAHIDVHHPKSHMTLGQYQNCRIPVCSPISPIVFVKFLLRSIYNTAYCTYETKIEVPATFFPLSITDSEREIPHLVLSGAFT